MKKIVKYLGKWKNSAEVEYDVYDVEDEKCPADVLIYHIKSNNAKFSEFHIVALSDGSNESAWGAGINERDALWDAKETYDKTAKEYGEDCGINPFELIFKKYFSWNQLSSTVNLKSEESLNK